MEQLARKYLQYNPLTGEIRWKALPEMYLRAVVGDLAGALDKGYIRITLAGKKYRAHRLAFVLMGQKAPAQVDHINGNRSDNRWSNLRKATAAINAKNARMRKDNTSGVAGVSYSKAHGKWKARVNSEGKELYLGLYANKTDAENSVILARHSLGYSERHGGLV